MVSDKGGFGVGILAYVKYLLALAAAGFCFYLAYGWLRLYGGSETLDGEKPAKPPLSFSAKYRPLTRQDALAILLITAVYAVVAFIGLGDRTAPESDCYFSGSGSYAVIELPEEREIGDVIYFSGLHTGKYYLQYSSDGVEYEDVGLLDQKYSLLFKWNKAEMNEGARTSAKFIRLVADDELCLNELAIYGPDGGRIDPRRMSFDAGAAPLFDEQEKIPARFSYMNSSYFDEIYHPRTALEHIEGIYPYEISHPPLGKLIISLGIRLFGMTPFGWRFMGTLFGVLMLPVLYVFLNELFGKRSISICGTVIFAFDFMHFVQTRIATIDTYAVFFILLMYLFMYRFVSGGSRRDLALSGLFFGLGAASKWTCIYAGAGLGVIWLIYWFTRRRDEDFWQELAGNILFCLVFFVAVPCAIYYMSYIPYGEARGMSGPGMLFSREYADIVIGNQKSMFNYHSGLVAEHPYSSSWYQWIVNGRPILYHLEYFDDGTKSTIGAFLSPLLCWGGLLAMFNMAFLVIIKRDGKALFILLGYLAQLLPWVLVTRLTFEYHYFTSVPFLLLALSRMFDACAEADMKKWRRPMYVFTAASVVLFIMFYPVLSGVTVSRQYASNVLQWLPSWPF